MHILNYRYLPTLLVCALCNGCAGWEPPPLVDEHPHPQIEPPKSSAAVVVSAKTDDVEPQVGMQTPVSPMSGLVLAEPDEVDSTARTQTPVSPVSVAALAEPDEGSVLRDPPPGMAKAEMLGELQRISVYREDTLPEIARANGLGFDEIRQANPGVDTWVPGEGTVVLLPTRMILPLQRQGLVLNLASRRLFYFDQDGSLIATYPIGVGREGWATPTGAAKVLSKAKDPVWFVPASIRAEHAEAGDPLPRQVDPGPDNPLGAYAILLDLPGYLIHGTNKPYGVGMRVSHGCVRLYPEDIESLYPRVPLGTPVTIMSEPIMLAEADGLLYLEAHPPSEDDEIWSGHWEQVQGRLLRDSRLASREIDWDRVKRIIEEARGIPLPVSLGSPEPEMVLAQIPWAEHARPLVQVKQDSGGGPDIDVDFDTDTGMDADTASETKTDSSTDTDTDTRTDSPAVAETALP